MHLFTGGINGRRYILASLVAPEENTIDSVGYKLARYKVVGTDLLNIYPIDSCQIKKAIERKQLEGLYQRSKKICHGRYVSSDAQTVREFLEKNQRSLFPKKIVFVRQKIPSAVETR